MPNLDCNTDRGRIATADQVDAVQAVLASRNPGTTFASTALDASAVVDGFFVTANGVIAALAEVKTRETDEKTFWIQFNGEWLVTEQKLIDIQTISRLLVVPSYGILYLKPSRVVLFKQFTDKFGDWKIVFRTEQTATQATCNGGVANRVNAFIKMHHAHKFNMPAHI